MARPHSNWSETLAKCGVPALVAMVPEVEEIVAAGKSAEKLRKKSADLQSRLS
ncbi:hypothetical protein [Polyangium sp. y55x31]|uniref:hypothetical protein n=1 Tax=Polyangium sp. y55x31 TaxID=3042688 RepID=UPI002482A85D|nr:hypothetical protein [Polyangium sp. y55x31]MDI1478692.1 hypothetical protein [Polyangium sp. y55x31]